MAKDGKKMAGKDPLEQGLSLPVCHGKMKVPTDRETEALEAMRSIKNRVRTLKKRREAVKVRNRDPMGGVAAIDGELARLKKDWDIWEQKRAAAQKKRMILLGHEKTH